MKPESVCFQVVQIHDLQNYLSLALILFLSQLLCHLSYQLDDQGVDSEPDFHFC